MIELMQRDDSFNELSPLAWVLRKINPQREFAVSVHNVGEKFVEKAQKRQAGSATRLSLGSWPVDPGRQNGTSDAL